MKTNLFTIATLLTIVFACLKVTNVIAWSWWLVFTPLLVWFALSVLVLILVGLMMLLVAAAIYKS